MSAYLKESLQPPNLENTLANKHRKLEDTPPLNTSIRALGCVSVYPLANDNVRLLILDLGESVEKSADYKKVLVSFRNAISYLRVMLLPSVSRGSWAISDSGT